MIKRNILYVSLHYICSPSQFSHPCLNHIHLAYIMNQSELKIIPYTATSISVFGRFIFMFLLYKNKSTNSLSLLFCILSILSSGMWIYYSSRADDLPMIVRSSFEITLLTVSSVYIIRNKIIARKDSAQILPS